MSDKIKIKKELQGYYFLVSKNVSINSQNINNTKRLEFKKKIIDTLDTANKAIIGIEEEYHLNDVNFLISDYSTKENKNNAIKEMNIAIKSLEDFKEKMSLYSDEEVKEDIMYLKEEIDKIKENKKNTIAILQAVENFKEKNRKLLDNK